MVATKPIATTVSYARAHDAVEFVDWSVGGSLTRRGASGPGPPRPDRSGSRRTRGTTLDISRTGSRKAIAPHRRCGVTSVPAIMSRPGPARAPRSCSCRWVRRWPGIVLLTLNPANRAAELKYLLAQSRSRAACSSIAASARWITRRSSTASRPSCRPLERSLLHGRLGRVATAAQMRRSR